jgi:hypothetical protein
MKKEITVHERLIRSDSPLNKIVSLILTLLTLTVIIFYSREFIFPNVEDDDYRTEFVNIETLESRNRAAQKEFSTTDGEVSEQTTDDTGSSDANNYVDLDFYPQVSKPSLIGRLRVKHPPVARDREIEAKAYIKLFISKYGEVKRVKVVRITLTKNAPPALAQKLKSEFKQNILKSLRGRRYRPAIINGSPTAVQSMQEIFLTLR